jgi:hypothetical protein
MKHTIKAFWFAFWGIVFLVAVLFGLPHFGIKIDDGPKYCIIVGIAIAGLGLGISVAVTSIVAGGESMIELIVNLTVKIKDNFKNHRYEWALSAFAILSAFVIQICKDLLPSDNEIIKEIVGAIIALIFLFSGLIWRKKWENNKTIYAKLGSIIIFLAPPIIICIMYFISSKQNFLVTVRNIPPEIYGLFGFFIFLFILALFLSWCESNNETKKQNGEP